jgi:hypothetical protein
MQCFDPISQKLSRLGLGAQNLSMSRALYTAGGKDTVNIHYHIQGTIFSPEGQSAFSQLNIWGWNWCWEKEDTQLCYHVDVCGVYCLAIYLLKCHGMRNGSNMLFNFVLEHCSGGVADNNITSLCRLDALTNLNTLGNNPRSLFSCVPLSIASG